MHAGQLTLAGLGSRGGSLRGCCRCRQLGAQLGLVRGRHLSLLLQAALQLSRLRRHCRLGLGRGCQAHLELCHACTRLLLRRLTRRRGVIQACLQCRQLLKLGIERGLQALGSNLHEGGGNGGGCSVERYRVRDVQQAGLVQRETAQHVIV